MSKRFLISLLTIITTVAFSQKMEFPAHWGEPPKMETMDLRPLPAGFGKGSSTKSAWITKHMNEDLKANHPERVKNLEGPWPEYVGIKGDVAKDILSLDTGLKVQVLKKGSPTTRDYRLDRVRIFVDEEGIVTNIPKKG